MLSLDQRRGVQDHENPCAKELQQHEICEMID